LGDVFEEEHRERKQAAKDYDCHRGARANVGDRESLFIDAHRQGSGARVASGQQENVVEFVESPDEAKQEQHAKDAQ